jgi:hypothetical protein
MKSLPRRAAEIGFSDWRYDVSCAIMGLAGSGHPVRTTVTEMDRCFWRLMNLNEVRKAC